MFISVQDIQGLIVKSKKSVSEAGIKDKDQLYLSTLGKHRANQLINGLMD